MSYTQTTEFYEIPLPQETDLVNPMDDNAAKERIDTALHSAVQNASSAIETANSASDAAAAATSGLEELSGIVNTEKGKLTALTARVTAAENEIDDVRSDDQDAICAFNEPTATSTHAYAIGDYFFYNNVLYKATAAIAISDTIVPNTNCEATNVTTEIDAINTALTAVNTSLSDKGTSTYIGKIEGDGTNKNISIDVNLAQYKSLYIEVLYQNLNSSGIINIPIDIFTQRNAVTVQDAGRNVGGVAYLVAGAIKIDAFTNLASDFAICVYGVK